MRGFEMKRSIPCFAGLGAVAVMTVLSCGESSEAPRISGEGIGVLDMELEVPFHDVTGLAWGAGLLWAVDDGEDAVYAVDTGTGDVLLSFPVSHEGSLDLTGLAYSEEHRMVLVGLWNGSTSGYVYRYSPEGDFKGSVSLCGG